VKESDEDKRILLNPEEIKASHGWRQAGWDRSEPSVAAPGDTARHLFRGIAWVGSLRWTGQICSWAATFMVMRLLRPEDYGLFGMAYVFIGIAQIFAEFGIGSTVIAMPGLKEEDEAQLHGASIFLGAGACLITLLASYPISRFYGEPRVVPLIVALGFPLLLNSAAAVPLARATKALDYQGMAVADLLRTLIPAMASLALAFLGAGVWSLVGGQVVAALAATTFLLLHTRTPISFPQPAQLKIPLKYSSEILMDRVAWMVYSGMPAIVGGRLLGAASLGEYIFAWTLASMPGEKLVNVITSVMTPLLAREQKNFGRLHALLGKMVEGIAWVTWPLLVGLALVAPLLVGVVFGEQWRGAVAGIEILAAYHIVRVVMAPFSQVFLVTGQARRNRQLSVLGALLLPGCFVAGALFWGPTGLALAWWVSVPLFLIPCLVFLRQIVGFGVGDFARALSGPALCSAMMAGGVVLSLHIMDFSELSRLVVTIAVGGIVYGTATALARRSKLAQLVAGVRGANGKSA
jgi:PST family polysaccharide transporter